MDDVNEMKLIGERDALEDLLDRFAAAVAPVAVIGEHSSGNDPWANALDMVTPAAEVERLRKELAAARTEVVEEHRRADDRRTELLEERDQALHDLAEAEAERDALKAATDRVRRMAQVWVDIRPTHPTTTREGHAIAYSGRRILAALDHPTKEAADAG
jgi:hypothetical protein